MKRFTLSFLLLSSLCACSPRPILEGKVNFVDYRPSANDLRTLHMDKAPENAGKNPEVLEIWDCEPYVKLYPGYAEISYTYSRLDPAKRKHFVHVVPTSKLELLRWEDNK